MQLFYLFEGLRLSPMVAGRVVSTLPEAAYDTRSVAGRFSLREAVAHLADWETINQDRLRKGIAEPGGKVPGLDESQRIIDMGYASKDPRTEMEVFAQRRAETLEILRSMTDEDWTKTVVHSERGELTLLELAVSILGHDMYHIEQFSQYITSLTV